MLTQIFTLRNQSLPTMVLGKCFDAILAFYAAIQILSISNNVDGQSIPDIIPKKHLRHRSLDEVQPSGEHNDETKNDIENEWQEWHYTPPTSGVQGNIDFFLLGGQSNMHGHVTSGASIGKNDTYWMQIKSILDAGGDHDGMEDDLFNAIFKANSQESEPEDVASRLANETMKLYTAGLLNDLDRPLSLGT